MSKSSARRRRAVVVTLGKTEITKLGEDGFSWGDVYHVIMSQSWPRFFAGVGGIYLLVNLVFAGAYALGDHAVNNADSFATCFFFSVETLATVGYGVMSPATTYGHVVATHGGVQPRWSLRLTILATATVAVASVSWFLFERPLNELKRYFPYGRRRRA